MRLSVTLVIGLMLGLSSAQDGVHIGDLVTKAHDVSGKVYVVDKDRLQIVNFNYDGLGPDAYFLFGIAGTTPNGQGTKIPDENGSLNLLGQYTNQRLVLTLPAGVNLQDIAWLSVYCIQASVNFGSLDFPATFAIPQAKMVGQFSSNAHGVSSEDVYILDKRRFRIEHLNYDGAGPDAFFLVGTSGVPNGGGTKVPDENGIITKLMAYNDATIIITLPENVDIDELTWLSMYCIQATSDFGSLILTGPHNNLPPYIEPRQEMALDNCETMKDEIFNVGWKIMGDNVIFEYEGTIDPSTGYMAFGISGSATGSVMVEGDVIVVYREGGVAKVKDYTLGAKALCSGVNGVCPDDVAGGMDNVVMLSASMQDGITKVRFQRPLAASDATQDKAIPTTGEAYVIWATGDVNTQGMVTKHKDHLHGDKMLEFGRAGAKNCQAVMPVEEEDVVPWDIPLISGENTKTFVAKIGPTGGRKGFEGITGTISWGIAWYINDMLIPELAVKRGETFTFTVEGGNDPSNAARYHPLYITDDPVGGYNSKTDAQKETVELLAGTTTNDSVTYGTDGHYCEYIAPNTNPETFDTFADYFDELTLECEDGEPGSFTWTPDSDTPDMVYYQCFTHNNLGWKIRVVDDYNEINGGSRTGGQISLVFAVLFMFISLAVSG